MVTGGEMGLQILILYKNWEIKAGKYIELSTRKKYLVGCPGTYRNVI